MSKTKKYVLAGLVLLLLLGVFVFDRPQVAAQATKPPQQVQVMNAAGAAPGQNVPISGSVALASGTNPVSAAQSGPWNVALATGTNPVSATQSGIWNVGINNTPTVNVGNLAAAPIPVRDVETAKFPVQLRFTSLLVDGQNSASQLVPYIVPGGKRLVIEYAGGFANLQVAGQGAIFGILIDSGQASMMTRFAGTTLGGFAIGAQQMRRYAEPGNSVTMSILRPVSTGIVQAEVSFSGYLVDVP